jgi:Outer membrane protein Omp28
MKSIKHLIFFIIALLSVSCSDTNVFYSEIPVDSSVDAPPVSGQFKKNVLIEDYTGTWCGNCIRVSYGIEKVFEKTDKAIVIAIHNGNDPYNFIGIQPLKDLISPNNPLELPQARLNRTITWTSPDTNYQQVKNLTSNNCALGLAMNSTVAEGMINLDVKVKFIQNYSNLKLVVYVLENKLIYNQENYSTYYGNIPPHHTTLNFEHNHVLRAPLTNLLGNPITQSSFDQTITANYSVAIPSNIANVNNMSFVAFVVDANNNVINARSSDANENQTFEENP